MRAKLTNVYSGKTTLSAGISQQTTRYEVCQGCRRVIVDKSLPLINGLRLCAICTCAKHPKVYSDGAKLSVPPRISRHKTRKVQLTSHLYELLFFKTDVAVPAEKVREMFHTPDLGTFYPKNAAEVQE